MCLRLGAEAEAAARKLTKRAAAAALAQWRLPLRTFPALLLPTQSERAVRAALLAAETAIKVGALNLVALPPLAAAMVAAAIRQK